jgi:hypothetical protein
MNKKYFLLKNGHTFSHTWKTVLEAKNKELKGNRLKQHYSWDDFSEECKAKKISYNDYYKIVMADKNYVISEIIDKYFN